MKGRGGVQHPARNPRQGGGRADRIGRQDRRYFSLSKRANKLVAPHGGHDQKQRLAASAHIRLGKRQTFSSMASSFSEGYLDSRPLAGMCYNGSME